MKFLLVFSGLLVAAPLNMEELHPIHLSVTEIYRTDAGDMEMSITFFMDDFGNAVNYEQYQEKISNGELSVDDLIMEYLQEKTQILLNGKAVKYTLDRKESNFPALTCYLKVTPQLHKLTSLTVENTMMLELFDDQRNMVHVRLPEREGSMLLDKKKTKATANF